LPTQFGAQLALCICPIGTGRTGDLYYLFPFTQINYSTAFLQLSISFFVQISYNDNADCANPPLDAIFNIVQSHCVFGFQTTPGSRSISCFNTATFDIVHIDRKLISNSFQEGLILSAQTRTRAPLSVDSSRLLSLHQNLEHSSLYTYAHLVP